LAGLLDFGSRKAIGIGQSLGPIALIKLKLKQGSDATVPFRQPSRHCEHISHDGTDTAHPYGSCINRKNGDGVQLYCSELTPYTAIATAMASS